MVNNLSKLLEGLGDRDRFWYENVGYSAPTTGLIRIARDLRRIGVDVENVVRIALSLHRFSYNDFDLTSLIMASLGMIRVMCWRLLSWLLSFNRYFRFDERPERVRKEVRKLLSEI